MRTPFLVPIRTVDGWVLSGATELNVSETTALVWCLLDGRSLDEVSTQVGAIVGSDASRGRAVVADALRELHADALFDGA